MGRSTPRGGRGRTSCFRTGIAWFPSRMIDKRRIVPGSVKDRTVRHLGPKRRAQIDGDHHKGISVMDRLLARALETKKVADIMDGWLEALSFDAVSYASAPATSNASGFGLTEAPRGALGHGMHITDGRIAFDVSGQCPRFRDAYIPPAEPARRTISVPRKGVPSASSPVTTSSTSLDAPADSESRRSTSPLRSNRTVKSGRPFPS